MVITMSTLDFEFPGPRSWIIGGILAIAGTGLVAMTLDLRIAQWVHSTHPMAAVHPLHPPLKFLGTFYFTLIIAALLAALHPATWRAALALVLSGIVAGLFYSIVKWCVGRIRPFHGVSAFRFTPFAGGLHGLLIGVKNASFPSGHACLAFAMASCLSSLLPRWRWGLWLLASMTAAARVLEGAHYPSDIVAAAALGILAATLTRPFAFRPSPSPCLPASSPSDACPSSAS
jgi:membrane-associated phospholipid phosphatase